MRLQLIRGFPWYLWVGVALFALGGTTDIAAHSFSGGAWERPAHLVTFAGMVMTVGAIFAEPLLHRRSP